MRTKISIAAICLLSIATACMSRASNAQQSDGWVTLLDAKSFANWKVAPDNAASKVVETATEKTIVAGDPRRDGKWEFKDGVLHAEGGISHIFSPRSDYENFDYKAEIKIKDKGNSGQYIRTAFGNGFPRGYEVQINSTHTDPKRTGSLYNFQNVTEMLVPPDTWFTQEVIAVGNHIIIKVNDKVAVDMSTRRIHSRRATSRFSSTTLAAKSGSGTCKSKNYKERQLTKGASSLRAPTP